MLAALGLVVWAALWADNEASVPAIAARITATAVADSATLARGAYLARLGNCAGCHTVRGGAAYAGGRGLATPFGTVYAGNLTPDPMTGLGRWSADDFWQALHHGRGRDGRHLLPAFPYPALTLVRRDDADALFAYLRSLAPVAQANTAHELRFPYNTQAALAIWRWLYFRPGALADDPSRSPEWNRGAYLVRGLGHCGACHAPRNLLGAGGSDLSGSLMPDGRWYAPALVPTLAPQAQQAAQAQARVELLQTGQSARGNALGPMAEVVYRSTQFWERADLRAAVAYLGSLAPVAAPPAGAPAPAEATARGARLYTDHCADCHGDQGLGVPGVYPALAGSVTVSQPLPLNLVQATQHGGFAPATAANPRPYGMPPQMLSDAELADVLSFVRQSWGHRASALSALDVMHLR